MSNQIKNKCGVNDTGKIYYDVDSIDVKVDPEKTRATNFEAIFLASVIDEITGSCFTIEENCKSQYPLVTKSNSRQWVTSIDQDNRVGLAHVIETSKVPILYNTPRLCDPGMTVSKNWSLKNYIETRLFAFKFKYDQGKTLSNRNKNSKDCYNSVYFDFRPFEYKMRLPNPANNKVVEEIYITEWITVEPGNDGGLGYTPHMRVSNLSMNKSNTKFQTKNIFKQMIKKVLSTRLGNNEKSIIKNSINIGPNGNTSMDVYIENFIVFLDRYDGIEFDFGNSNNTGTTQTLKMTDRAISVLYFDLIHDSVFKKNEFGLLKFKKSFKSQFITLSKTKNGPAKGVMEVDFLVGAKMAQKSHNAYGGQTGNILINTWGGGDVRVNGKGPVIKNVPSIFKTLGDLSQFIYAVTYDTVVASGDKMGMAAGLFMTASNNRKLRLMMEDTKTGFVLYTGFPKIDFVSRSTCSSQKGGACSLSNKTIRNKSTVVQRLQSSVNNGNIANKILASRPVRPKLDTNMGTFIGANNVPLNKNTSQTFFKKVEKFLPYFTDNEFDKVDKILVAIEKRTNPENRNTVLRDLRALRGNIRDARSNPFKQASPSRNTQNQASAMNATQTPTSKKRSRNNATPSPTNRTPNQTQASAMNTNNRTKLSNFMKNLNRLTENNKKKYLNQLNTSGSNFNTIKNAAYDTHRIREFRTLLGNNINALSTNQLTKYEQQIRKGGKLQNIFNNAKRAAQKNGVTTRSAKISRT